MRTREQIKEEMAKIKGGDWDEYYDKLTPEEIKLYREIFKELQKKERR
tara:strand:- start:970 stop:1113 length:144 start_codon:yes stop_codon:yes gene_type:complete